MKISTNNTITTRRSEDQWSRIVLQYELKQLKREQQHLSSKAMERPLTRWESLRLSNIADELMELLSKFTLIQNLA